MIIVYAMSRNLYPCFLPTLTSLLEHNDPERIYILAEDSCLPYDLPDICKVINVAGQTVFPPTGPNSRTVFTYMAMMRACYTDLLPTEHKVIQLDIDTIICDSLEPLWDIDMTGKWLAACPEYKGIYKPWDKTYYNIGVAVYNLDQMRADNAMGKMVNMLNTRHLWCIEQDAINFFAVPDKVVPIPVRYNESFCCGQTDHPAVVHYAGFPDWWTRSDMPRVGYLDRYRTASQLPPV